MLGLLTKDTYLLIQRKQTLLIFVGISLMMGYTMDGSFIVGYMCVLSCIMAVGTISYDEFDNGLMFLLTLPCDRKSYALAKYLFCGLVCGVGWIFSVVLMFVMNAVKGLPMEVVENLTGAVACLPIIALMADLLIPIQLKFGAEKSRMVMALLGGGVMVIAVLVQRMGMAGALLRTLDSIPTAVYGVVGLVVTVAVTVCSILASIHIMEGKTF